MSRKKDYYNFWANKKPIRLSLPLFDFWHTRMLRQAEEKIPDFSWRQIYLIGKKQI